MNQFGFGIFHSFSHLIHLNVIFGFDINMFAFQFVPHYAHHPAPPPPPAPGPPAPYPYWSSSGAGPTPAPPPGGGILMSTTSGATSPCSGYYTNPVGALQERFQSQGITPNYRVLQAEGASHCPTFTYQVNVGDFYAVGEFLLISLFLL